MRTCCKRLGVAAVEWVAVEEAQESAGMGGSGDVEAEAFANVERELGAVLNAAALAGGRRMFAAQVPQIPQVGALHTCRCTHMHIYMRI